MEHDVILHEGHDQDDVISERFIKDIHLRLLKLIKLINQVSGNNGTMIVDLTYARQQLALKLECPYIQVVDQRVRVYFEGATYITEHDTQEVMTIRLALANMFLLFSRAVHAREIPTEHPVNCIWPHIEFDHFALYVKCDGGVSRFEFTPPSVPIS